jgi:integrase
MLTKSKIDRAVRAGVPAGKAHVVLWDSAPVGLGLKIRATGSNAWVFQFRPKGVGRSEAARTLTFGSWPSVTLDAARAAATAKAGEVALGKDPAAERRDERTRERRVVSRALDEFELAIKRRRLVNVPTIMSTLRRGLAPLASREIDALTRADFVDRIDALEAAGKPGAATDLRKHARSLLEWAVSKGLAPYNVLAGLRRPRASRAERLDDARKGRALSDDEIAVLWRSAGSLGPFGGLLRLGLLTGMRRSELAALRWSDVRDDRIVVEAHGTKTGVRHEVPVTSAMRAVLTAQPKDTSGLVFPSPRRRREAKLSGWTQLVAAAVKRSGVDFRLHDLRRSCRTLMSRLGIAEDAAELAIGHVRRGLIGTYNKDDASRARAEAFALVSEHISKIVAGAGPGASASGLAVVSTFRRQQTGASRANYTTDHNL